MKRYLTVFALLVLAGCSITSPYKAAETTEQKAYAVAASYNVVLESARDIVVDTTVNNDVRRAVQRATQRTTPVMSSLEDAVALYTAERVKFESGQSTQDKLNVVADNLALWLVQGEQALIDLVTAIQGE